MKDFYFAAVLGFQAARMTSSISLGRPNCARDCPIRWLLKVEALEIVGELSTVWIVEKVFLDLKGDEWDLSDGRALLEASTVLSTWVKSWSIGFVSDKFRYGCSYKAKRWKCIYFMSFQTEIKSICCNTIWVWHLRNIFIYLFVETVGKQIDLRIKLKPVT